MNTFLRLGLLSVLTILLIHKADWTAAKPTETDVNWGSSESKEEESCPKGHFWHIRGQYCVPEQCPRGNAYRNRRTGNCLYSKASLKGSQPDSLEKIGTNGWAIGSQGFYQPRGMSIVRFYKLNNGKRRHDGGGKTSPKRTWSRG